MNDKNISKGLRSPGTLGKKPLIGLVMFVIGSLIFAVLAYSLVANSLLISWDLPLANSLNALALQSSSLVIGIMIAGFYVGGAWVIAPIAALFGLYFIYKKFWRELVMLAASLGGGILLFELLSNIFNRPRPYLLFEKLIWTGTPQIPGFPSGHTLNILILCGFLLYLFLPKIKSRLGKILVVSAAVLLPIYVGFSRIYIGDHYLTDILAGYAAGIAWFGLSLTVVELLFKKKEVK